MLRRMLMGLGFAAAVSGASLAGSSPQFSFGSIDGGVIDLAAFAGKPVLVVNTASRCGFVGQFDGLQALQDRFGPRGLTVIGVPSNSFRQELGSGGAVKEFCEMNFGIDFPMTEIVDVIGRDAHPFYSWAREQGVAPRWNFYKILLDGEGRIAESFGTTVSPQSPKVIAAIEALLPAPE